MENDLIIRMHCKWFYYKNTLQMILLQECIANDFSIRIHCKWFFYKNTLQMILQ